MDLFLQLLANGLVIGTFYALSALGLTLVFGLMRVVNFAHGELYVVGGLLGWSLTDLVGLNFFLTLAVVIFSLAVGGYLIDRLLMARVRGQGEEPTILLTIGLSIFLTNTALLIVGTAPEKVVSPFANKPLFFGPVVITQSRLVLVAISAALILAGPCRPDAGWPKHGTALAFYRERRQARRRPHLGARRGSLSGSLPRMVHQ